MNKMLKMIIFITIFAAICTTYLTGNTYAEESIGGTREGQHYENTYFEIQIDFPDEWELMSDEELSRLSIAGIVYDLSAQNTTCGINFAYVPASVEEDKRFTEEGLAESNLETLEAYLNANPSVKFPSVKKTTCTVAGKEHAAVRSEYAIVMQQGEYGQGGSTLMYAIDETVFIVKEQHFATITVSTSGREPQELLDLFEPINPATTYTNQARNDELIQKFLQMHPDYVFGTWIDTNQDGVNELLVSPRDNRVEQIPALFCALSSDGQKLYSWSLYSSSSPFKYDLEGNSIVCDSSGTGVYERFVIHLSDDSLQVRRIGRKSPMDRQESYYYDYTENIQGGEEISIYPRFGEVIGSSGATDWEFLNQYAITKEEYEKIQKYYADLDRMIFYNTPSYSAQ